MGMFARLLLRVLALPVVAWAAGAIWIDGPESRVVAGALVGGYVTASLVLLVRRPLRRNFILAAVLFAVVVGWWLSIPPSNDRTWMADVANLPVATFDGDLVTVSNIRDFDYHSETDFDERWETRTYDLSQITGLDLFICYWGPTMIAHTIMSWEFSDGRHLAVSIETRKEQGEEYSALLGFYRQFELYYVVADERDVIGVRTDHRGEQVFLYRLRTPYDRSRALLERYLRRVDALNETPDWYNAFSKNCTTVIFDHVRPIVGKVPFDYRMLVNGQLDQLMYEREAFNQDLPFAELREVSEITDASIAADGAEDFSERIRVGLPPRPPPPKD
jgi:hypothetical protein